MIESYICKFGLYHDKPCKNSQPSSNNGWLYTALSKYALSQKYEKSDFMDLFESCFTSGKHYKLDREKLYYINRLPGKIYPPVSRDEIIGQVSLGLPIENMLILAAGWKLYNPHFIGHYPLWISIKALWKIRNKHRNTFWQESIYPAFPLAMNILWHDRYYICHMRGFNWNLKYFLAFYLYALTTAIKGSPGEKNILYLQLRDMKNPLYKLINFKSNLLKYFGSSHIFNTLPLTK